MLYISAGDDDDSSYDNADSNDVAITVKHITLPTNGYK